MSRTLASRTWVRWVTFGARQILGIVLIVAGALKLPWPESSVQAVRAYQLLPFDLTRPVGYALPVLEVVIGLLLVLGLFTRIAGWLGAAILVAFIIGISWVWGAVSRSTAAASVAAARAQTASASTLGRSA